MIAQEISKPADASDVGESAEAARAEVVRLRALLRAQAETVGVSPEPEVAQGASGDSVNDEASSGMEVWAYVGTAKNDSGHKFGDYDFRRVLFDRGTLTGEEPSVTMDIEYTPANGGSVGGYRSRYTMKWNVETGHVGTPGESWQGKLLNGGVPGAPMDFRNKWDNILYFTPVKRLPACALLDEDNPPGASEPALTEEENAAGAGVPGTESEESWKQAKWFMEEPILSRKEEHELGEEKHSQARSAALAWVVAALDVDEPSETLVLLLKRIFKARRFTFFLKQDEFERLRGICSSELDRIGARLADYYNAEGLQAALGKLGTNVWPESLPKRPRQCDLIPTPIRGCYYPKNSATSQTVSLSEYVYINLLILIGLGINDEFQQRAGEAVRRAVPSAVYRGAPVKGFHRM